MSNSILNPDRCLIIGEIGQGHEGSMARAYQLIDLIAASGADAVKFQTHIAAAESTPGEPWRVKLNTDDASRYDYWKRMEFTEKEWLDLKNYSESKGLVFLSTPFSIEAVDLLSRIGVKAWKIGSGETNNLPMLDHLAKTGLPVLLSTGMSPLSEIDMIVKYLKTKDVPIAVMQCTSMYPTPPEKIGLNIIPFFRDRYDCFVGLSDHSGTIYPALAAAGLGIDVLEVHVMLGPEDKGPDVSSSVSGTELKQIVDGIRLIERTRKNPVDKDEMAVELQYMREIFNKSVVAKKDLKAGTVLQADDLAVKKPGTGIPAAKLTDVIGKTLLVDKKSDDVFKEADLK